MPSTSMPTPFAPACRSLSAFYQRTHSTIPSMSREAQVRQFAAVIGKILDIQWYICYQRKFSVQSFRVTDIQQLFNHHSSYTTHTTTHHTSLIIHHSSYTTHHTPLIIYHSSYTSHHTPLIIHHSSYTTHHTLLIIHHSSYKTHHTPVIIHHSSYTTHHTPLIIHQSPYTTQHTPLIIHHSSYTTHHTLLIIQFALPPVGSSVNSSSSNKLHLALVSTAQAPGNSSSRCRFRGRCRTL